MYGIGHNQGPALNKNIEALQSGMKFRLQITTSRLQPVAPEFAATKAQATRRRKELTECGYRVHVFAITEAGGLTA